MHHSKQNALGSFFELSVDTHQAYGRTSALHPHLPGQHPHNPVDRDVFKLDRETYWKSRAQAEKRYSFK
ncbi:MULTISPECIES: HNH/ENDO VII family nuclease [unclassified Pseudomonas]|uniref:HNH/ENDO VII family nuclease n=1 Tax=unclassified Pseudomonas TaxID=196821 RepID=UPI000A1DE187